MFDEFMSNVIQASCFTIFQLFDRLLEFILQKSFFNQLLYCATRAPGSASRFRGNVFLPVITSPATDD